MPSPVYNTLHRSENAPSSALLFFVVVVGHEKVQHAVLFSSSVEAGLRNVSMLTFVRRRIEPVLEEEPAARPMPLCLDAEDRNLQHAEDCACMTCRRQTDCLFSCAGCTFLDPR